MTRFGITGYRPIRCSKISFGALQRRHPTSIRESIFALGTLVAHLDRCFARGHALRAVAVFSLQTPTCAALVDLG